MADSLGPFSDRKTSAKVEPAIFYRLLNPLRLKLARMARKPPGTLINMNNGTNSYSAKSAGASREQKVGLSILVVVSLLLLPTLVYLGLATPNQLIRLFPDDAFYYLETAFNTIKYGFATFDGINATNGFHPLQYFLSVGMALAGDKERILQFAVLENALLVIATSLVVSTHFFEHFENRVKLVATVILAFPLWYLYLWLDAGMEMALVLFCGALFYCLWEKTYLSDFSSLPLNCTLAMSGALLVLSRLDTAIVLIPLAILYLYFIYQRRLGWKQVLIPALGGLVILLPYLLWNWIGFGHLVPISGIVKSDAQLNIAANWRGLTSGQPLGILIAFTPFFLGIAALLLSLKKKNSVCLFILAVSTTIYYGYIFLHARHVFRWYLAFPMVLQIISLGIILKSLINTHFFATLFTKKFLLPVVITATIAFHGALYLWSMSINTTAFYLKAVADDMNEKLSSDDRIATFDAGVIGFFSKTRVINLDGLINSFDYYKNYYKKNKFNDYFHKSGVTHFLARRAAIHISGNESNVVHQFVRDSEVDLRKDKIVGEYKIPGQFELILYELRSSGGES